MSELPGDIQVARVKGIADELFENAQVIGDDGGRISVEGVDNTPIVCVHVPLVDANGNPKRHSFAMPLEGMADMTTEALTGQLRISAERAEAKGARLLKRAT